jgi:hypothetical protein
MYVYFQAPANVYDESKVAALTEKSTSLEKENKALWNSVNMEKGLLIYMFIFLFPYCCFFVYSFIFLCNLHNYETQKKRKNWKNDLKILPLSYQI